jgi:hypothetical protein
MLQSYKVLYKWKWTGTRAWELLQEKGRDIGLQVYQVIHIRYIRRAPRTRATYFVAKKRTFPQTPRRWPDELNL